MEELTHFVLNVGKTSTKLSDLMHRMSPIHIGPKRELVAKIKQLNAQAQKAAAEHG